MYYFVKGAHVWRRKIGLKLFSQSRTAVRSRLAASPLCGYHAIRNLEGDQTFPE
jgi:hypothetical protein